MPFPFNPFGTSGRVGEIDGPVGSTDNAIARWDGATGLVLQNSVVIIDDTGNVTGVVDLTATGTIDAATYTIGGVAFAHSDLAGVGEDDHHNAFEGLEDNVGAAITPAADNRIQFTDDDKINVDAGGAGVLALSIDEAQFVNIPESALAAAVQAQLVTNGDSHDHSGGDGGTIAHANLSGLANDDHTQYILATGARAMTGDLNLGTNNITNVGNVDGVDVSDHSARHESGGADAIKLDDLAAPDDNTDLNVSITAHGLAPKAPDDAAQYLDGTGSWSTPSGGSGVDVRQSILSADMDANGYCDIIGGTGTATATIEATDADLVMAWAQGYDTDGLPVDYTYAEDADQTVAMTAAAINYIYADYNAGSPTYSKTLYQPQYLEVEPSDGADFDVSLCTFDGVDGATAFTGAYGETVTFEGDADLDNTTTPHGETTSLRVQGSNDYVTIPALDMSKFWTIEFEFNPDDATPASATTLFEGSDNHQIVLELTSGGVLRINIGTGAAWDIASAQSGSTTLTDATWHHIAIVWDEANYKVYLDNTLEINVASASAIEQPTNYYLGARYDGSQDTTGYFANFRFSPYGRYLSAGFTLPTTFSADDLYYFNIPEMKMYVGNNTDGWVADTILFLGEADVGADGDIDSVVSYAIRGRYDSGYAAIAADTTYSFNHSIGVTPDHVSGYLKCITAENGFAIGDVVNTSKDGATADAGMSLLSTRNTAKWIQGANGGGAILPSTNNNGFFTFVYWHKRIVCERGW